MLLTHFDLLFDRNAKLGFAIALSFYSFYKLVNQTTNSICCRLVFTFMTHWLMPINTNRIY